MPIRKDRPAPGTAPGTLPERPKTLESTVIHLVRYGPEEILEKDLVGGAAPPPTDASLTTWLDVEGHDVHQLAEIGRQLNVHSLVLEDMVNVGQRPKVEDYDDSLFIVLDHFFLNDEEDSLQKEQISIILQDQSVLSVRESRSGLF